MKSRKRIIFIGLIFTFLASCKENVKIGKEHYPNGKVKKEVRYKNSLKNREEIYYYPNGVLRKKYFYINDSLNGNFFSYDITGAITSKGHYKDGLPVGPAYYYYKTHLVLYNERDFNGDVYYVKKYDSTSNKLVKEEGVCISPNLIIRSMGGSKRQEVLFLYAEPEGYSNTLSVFIGDTRINYDTLGAHVGKIDISILENTGDSIKIFSTLRSNNSAIICKDSIISILK